MRRGRDYLSDDDRGAEINMSPLVDMVFLLLIFFIVTTVFTRETGLEVRKPRAASATALPGESLLIALGADGALVHAGRALSLGEVRGLVARQVRGRPELPVVLVADERGHTGRLVEVLDECKRAGARNVSIATRAP
jgi:biopolymer transport protein ExbD